MKSVLKSDQSDWCVVPSTYLKHIYIKCMKLRKICMFIHLQVLFSNDYLKNVIFVVSCMGCSEVSVWFVLTGYTSNPVLYAARLQFSQKQLKTSEYMI